MADHTPSLSGTDLDILLGKEVELTVEKGRAGFRHGNVIITSWCSETPDIATMAVLASVTRTGPLDYTATFSTLEGDIQIKPDFGYDDLWQPFVLDVRLPDDRYLNFGLVEVMGSDLIVVDSLTGHKHIFTHNGEANISAHKGNGWGRLSFSYSHGEGIAVEAEFKGKTERIATISFPPGTLRDLTYRVE